MYKNRCRGMITALPPGIWKVRPALWVDPETDALIPAIVAQVTVGILPARVGGRGRPDRLMSSSIIVILVAQCSATPASVAAATPCSATPFQRQLDVRHSWQFKGNRCDRAF